MLNLFSRSFWLKGKPGYVSHKWAPLSDAVDWICGSGGRAVIAHPARYKLGKELLDELLFEFRALGGSAIEVITASHTPEQALLFAHHANRMGLLASRGFRFSWAWGELFRYRSDARISSRLYAHLA